MPKNVTIPTRDEILKTRGTKLNPAYMTFYKKHLYITQGHMQYLWDNEGKRYNLRYIVNRSESFAISLYPRRAKRALGSEENSRGVLLIDSEMAGPI